jgi:hypothetical protein
MARGGRRSSLNSDLRPVPDRAELVDHLFFPTPLGYPESVRLLPVLPALAVLVACAPAPQPAAQPKPDLTTEDWYRQTTGELTALNHDAEALLKARQFDPAAALITKGQPLETRLLAVPQPTLAAMEAASDLDDLYGRMLLRNRHYNWASSIFQKNVIRWKTWKPQTPETERRLKVALSAIAECNRHPQE